LETDSRKQILILGAGFGGLNTALHLERVLRPDTPAEVTLIDRNHFHLFTPLLHEVAAGVIDAGLILTPIRRVVSKTRINFLRARVDGIDLEKQTVALCCEEKPYDVLVIALGSVTNFHSLDSVRGKALEMKEASDVEALRCHIINRFEAAAREDDKRLRKRLLTFAVVGGGCTGVETVTEIREFLTHLRKEQYPSIPPEEVRSVLVEVQDRVLSQMDRTLSRTALRRMEEMGIEMMLNTVVTDFTEVGLVFADGNKPLPTDTVIWTGGVKAPPVVEALPLEKDRMSRIVVNSDLSVPGMPNVYVLGDAAHANHPKTREIYPPTAQVAYRQAPVVAHNIAADLEGGERENFDFTYIGDLVSLGRLSGVADPFGVRVRGRLAWALWKFYYLTSLVGWQNRLRVAFNWFLALLFPTNSALAHECAAECTEELCMLRGSRWETGES
jgi:NADH dehydrogenase